MLRSVERGERIAVVAPGKIVPHEARA
jgi:hypothetical protein